MSVHDRGQRSKTILLQAVSHSCMPCVDSSDSNAVTEYHQCNVPTRIFQHKLRKQFDVRQLCIESGISWSPSLNGEYTVRVAAVIAVIIAANSCADCRTIATLIAVHRQRRSRRRARITNKFVNWWNCCVWLFLFFYLVYSSFVLSVAYSCTSVAWIFNKVSVSVCTNLRSLRILDPAVTRMA